MSKKTKSAPMPDPAASNAADIPATYQARANRIFAWMSDVNQLYFTSDGNCFTEHQHAMAHARKFEDQTIITIERQ